MFRNAKTNHFAPCCLQALFLIVWISWSTSSAQELAKSFSPPAEFANDFGSYRSPLLFEDGSTVMNAADWARRREEIRNKWMKLLGVWPELQTKPMVEVLSEEEREGLLQQNLKIEIAPGMFTSDAYLIKPSSPGPHPGVVVVYYDAKTGIGLGKAALRDFAYQLAKRGFVALSLGSNPETYYPDKANCELQPLAFHAYEAATCHAVLANLSDVDPNRIGIVGHSYGGKWAMFASCLFDRFACAAWSDGGIVFDESRGNVNYWERWYLGYEKGISDRTPGIPSASNPRTGAYRTMIEKGYDLHELHALMAPRPFLVSGGSEDPPSRWQALNHSLAVNKLLGYRDRVAMTNRPKHDPTEESNEQIYQFFEHFLKTNAAK